MKWIYIIEHKLKAALCLGIILFVVLWNNIGESNKMIKLGESFNTIYDDRLMAENYIYQMSELLHQGQLLLPENIDNIQKPQFAIQFSQILNQLKPIISLYENTVLTHKESVLFVSLKNDISRLEDEMVTLTLLKNVQKQKNAHQINFTIENSLKTLSGMSEIQVVVGKELREQSEASIKSSVISAQFEVALLVVIALIIQALIFASKSVQTKFQQQSHLN